MKSRYTLIAFMAALLLLASCATNKQVSYFQDLQDAQDSTAQQEQPAPEIRLRPEDKISIIVNSKDPELTTLFNLPYTARILGQSSEMINK